MGETVFIVPHGIAEGFSFATVAVTVLAVLAAGLPLAGDMKRLRGIARLGIDHIEALIVMGNLVHELQRERGLSAAHASSPAQNPEPVTEQHRRTDRFLGQWRNSIDTLTLQGRAAATREAVRVQISALAQSRARLLGNGLEPAAVVATYSAVIAALLEMSVAIVRATARGPTSRAALAYCNLLQAKEAAGRERATLTAALKAPPLPPSTRERCLDLVMTQEMYLRQFDLLASGEMAAFLKSSLSEVDGQIRAMRIAAAPENGMPTVSPQDWFALSSRRIDALKTVEDRLADAMKAGAVQFIATTQFQTWVARTMVGISVAATVSMIVLTRVFL